MQIDTESLLVGMALLVAKAFGIVLWNKEKRQERELSELSKDHNEFKLKVSENYATKYDLNQSVGRIERKLDKLLDKK